MKKYWDKLVHFIKEKPYLFVGIMVLLAIVIGKLFSGKSSNENTTLESINNSGQDGEYSTPYPITTQPATGTTYTPPNNSSSLTPSPVTHYPSIPDVVRAPVRETVMIMPSNNNNSGWSTGGNYLSSRNPNDGLSSITSWGGYTNDKGVNTGGKIDVGKTIVNGVLNPTGTAINLGANIVSGLLNSIFNGGSQTYTAQQKALNEYNEIDQALADGKVTFATKTPVDENAIGFNLPTNITVDNTPSENESYGGGGSGGNGNGYGSGGNYGSSNDSGHSGDHQSDGGDKG